MSSRRLRAHPPGGPHRRQEPTHEHPAQTVGKGTEMTPEQWKNREQQCFSVPYLSKIGVGWAETLIDWLRGRGYRVNESGPYNPETGRGCYSHPCEWRRDHVRVRVNPDGVILLRDPGCTIQIGRPVGHGMTEVISPNQHRLDFPSSTIPLIQKRIEGFENRRAFTVIEARSHFFGEKV